MNGPPRFFGAFSAHSVQISGVAQRDAAISPNSSISCPHYAITRQETRPSRSGVFLGKFAKWLGRLSRIEVGPTALLPAACRPFDRGTTGVTQNTRGVVLAIR